MPNAVQHLRCRALYLTLAASLLLASAPTCPAFVARNPRAFSDGSARARYLNPNTGRFWTADSFVGQQEEPLSLHKYLYCHSDPVNFSDASGQWEGGIVGTVNTITLQGYVRTAMFVATRPVLARVSGLAISLFISSQIDPDALQGLPQFQGLSGLQTAEVKLLDALKRGPVYTALTAQLRGWISREAGLEFQKFLQRNVFRFVLEVNRRVSEVTKHEVDFVLDNAIVEAKNTPRIDNEQLAAIAEFAKRQGKEFWYVFLEKPGRSAIDKIKQAGGKVSWFLDETDR
jgi:RHS repeat-associated protein